MSTYESYDTVSKQYDSGRCPGGVELYRGFLVSRLQKPLNEIHLLDAGCGTGNYAESLLREGIGRMTLLDASEGMLNVAKTKLQTYMDVGRVQEFRLASVLKMPYEDDAAFDAVMVNFVLHHLEDGTDPSFGNTSVALKEIYRVLKSGGMLLFQTCSHYQFLANRTTFFLGERARNECLKKIPTITQYKQLMQDVGFSTPVRYIEPGCLLVDSDTYYDDLGITRKEWRDHSSAFALQTQEETDAMLARVYKMKEDGTLHKKLAETDEMQQNAGMFTILIASKSMDV